MQRWTRKVGEDKDEIELLEPVLDSLKVADLDLGEGDDGERHVGQVDETVGRRLEEHVRSERHSLETELPERNVDVEPVRAVRVVGGCGDLLGEGLELAVERLSELALLLLELNLVLVPVSVLSLLVAGLVKLDVGRLARELDVLEERKDSVSVSCRSGTPG